MPLSTLQCYCPFLSIKKPQLRCLAVLLDSEEAPSQTEDGLDPRISQLSESQSGDLLTHWPGATETKFTEKLEGSLLSPSLQKDDGILSIIVTTTDGQVHCIRGVHSGRMEERNHFCLLLALQDEMLHSDFSEVWEAKCLPPGKTIFDGKS